MSGTDLIISDDKNRRKMPAGVFVRVQPEAPSPLAYNIAPTE